MTEEEQLKTYIPKKQVDIILDTDTFNEIDDQYAISYLLANQDRIHIKGFTVAPFYNEALVKDIAEGQKKSKLEIIKILKLTKNDSFIDYIYGGSDQFLQNEHNPINSPAAKFIISESKNYNASNPLYVVGIGAITNIASAILLDPTIVERICVVWLGGSSLGWWINHEYNMFQDFAAVRVVMSSAVPFVQLPAQGVISEFVTTQYELEHWLNGKNKIGTFLYNRTLEVALANTKHKAWSRVIWDVLAVAWLINDDNRFMWGRIENRYLPAYEGNKYEDKPLDLKMYYVHQINRDALMSDLFEKISNL